MKNIQKDFPIFSHTINDKQLIYLDNASTTHKPQVVLDAMTAFYTTTNSNISRGIYSLGEQATQSYHNARTKVADFIGARMSSEIIFTSGTTDSINRIAATWGMDHIHENDEIVLTELEHHANLVPWQQVAQKKGARLEFIPVLPNGSVDYTHLDSIINHKTKIVTITHISNAIGTHVDIERIIKRARTVGARILIDAAQSIAHQSINVSHLDCDFLVFSGHKIFGPTGIGVLYIKQELHDTVRPYTFGGGMVTNVTFTDALFATAPDKFEAGTPPIAQAIGLGAAIDYFRTTINFNELRIHEAALIAQLIASCQHYTMSHISIIGPIQELKTSGHILSFIVKGMHAHDVAFFLDRHGISVRAGNHCAQPLAHKLGYIATVRVSVHAYTTPQDIEHLAQALLLLKPK